MAVTLNGYMNSGRMGLVRDLMIKENQKLFNYINVLSDGIIVYAMLPLAFWIRFHVFTGIISVPLTAYLRMGVLLTAAHLVTYSSFGLYRSFRHTSLSTELSKLFWAGALDMAVLLSLLFLLHGMYYSRWTLAIFFVLNLTALGVKRIILRKALRYVRKRGFNQKYVLIMGGGKMARAYLRAIKRERDLGYQCVGYVASHPSSGWGETPYLGGFEELDSILNRPGLDEVVSAIDLEDYGRTPEIIASCEKAGLKLSIIPFYAEFMPSNPEFDELCGLPLLNIRRIPLDNLLNAFVKRTFDIVGSLLLIIVTVPLFIFCAVGVGVTSPGPVIFRQERVGRGKKHFYMYKFRSMRVNDRQDTGWSEQSDGRKTKFGAFMRKCSMDELPQLWNVLRGDMSLVGPRPELPYFVEQFREEVPLYMVKHRVRPGMTGWAQVNGFRGDTSIKGRVEHDIYYIEHWSLGFDIKILLKTVFQGRFINNEAMT